MSNLLREKIEKIIRYISAIAFVIMIPLGVIQYHYVKGNMYDKRDLSKMDPIWQERYYGMALSPVTPETRVLNMIARDAPHSSKIYAFYKTMGW